MPSLFLTGYENETIEEFLQKLQEQGITIVIDVREIPLSRKYGFSKKQLMGKLQELGIKYFHFSQLGSPSAIRHALRNGDIDYLEFFKKYRNYVQHKKDVYQEVLDIILHNQKTSLLCFEEESDLCHRSILTSEILKLNHHIKVTPL